MSELQDIDSTWSLGDDSYCDTCGYSWNQIGLELWDEEEDVWQLYIRVGCTGGDAVMSTDDDWGAKSEDIIRDALSFSDFSEKDAKDLRAKFALIKGEQK
jgi:hypothetical protein